MDYCADIQTLYPRVSWAVVEKAEIQQRRLELGLCRGRTRECTSRVPVLIVPARATESDAAGESDAA